MGIHNQKPHYEHLKNKWTDRHIQLREKLWSKHGESLHWFARNAKQLAAGSAASLLLLTSPVKLPGIPLQATASELIKHIDIDKNVFLISDLSSLLPKDIQPLTADEEKQITAILSRDFGFKVIAELAGKRLPRNYGLIGAEQHLARYPGDSIDTHFSSEEEAQQFYSSGMASGLGAWGYFAFSQDQMTQQDLLREKFYIAVPTFLSEGFNDRFAEYRDFYKYRKMLVVNPQNGKAIVADIADAGPATFTGKHLGGSPEVMKYLERVDGSGVGPVLYFFIDDQDDKISLGPVVPK